MENSHIGSQPYGGQHVNYSRYILLICAILTIVAFILPFGRIIGLPLIVLSTLFHEIGHGMAAILVGYEFQQLDLWSNGSGLATVSGSGSRLSTAIIAAGGLLGPSFAAALSFIAAKRAWSSRILFASLGIGFIILNILCVRNLFGFIFVGLLAALFVWIAFQNRPWLMQTSLAFIAIQLSLSVFSRMDYLFTKTAIISNQIVPSDVAAIAEALFLPYWFWGAICALISILVLALGLWSYIKQ